MVAMTGTGGARTAPIERRRVRGPVGWPRRRRRRSSWVLVALTLVLVVVAGTSADAATVTARPSSWDPRVVDVVRDVERLRGLEFEHPVPVVVLDDAAFEKRFLGTGRPTARDRREWAQIQGAFIAMGLQDEPVGLNVVTRASGSNVVGFYDPRRKAIVVRGSTLDEPGTRVTLAHELTHALQDQHFDLVALQKRGAKADSMLTKALIEGDATDVGRRYYAEMDTADQKAVDATNDSVQAEATPLPAFLEAVFYAPYTLGVESVAVVRALQGRPGLDTLMRTPPTRDLGLVDPTALIGPRQWERVGAPAVRAPDVAQGDPFPMDAVGLYLVLAEHLDWTEALSVSERWGGDRTVAFTRAGLPCVTMRIAGRTGAGDAARIGDAFRRWATGAGTTTTVVSEGERVRVTLCDPADHRGAATPTPPARALVGLSIRNDLVAQGIAAGSDPEVAKCAADRLARLPETGAVVGAVDTLQTDVPDALTRAFRRALGEQFTPSLRACATSV